MKKPRLLKKPQPVPPGLLKSENEIAIFGGSEPSGWTFHVIVFGRMEDLVAAVLDPRGEIRFQYHGEPKFTHPIGFDEVTMFASEDVVAISAYITNLIQRHRPH